MQQIKNKRTKNRRKPKSKKMREENNIEEIGFTASNSKRAAKDGREYELLFPAPDGREMLLKRNASVEETVKHMRQIVKMYAWQTAEISKGLKGNSTYSTCQKIWHFLYDHIKYKEDDAGEEQLRTPALSWFIRTSRGIDCDDFSLFAGCILKNLGIPFYFRIAKYYDSKNPEGFSHVYVVVPQTERRYIVIDAVLNQYDMEKSPIKEYKDFKVMDKENLNGVDITLLSGTDSATENEIESLISGAHFPGRGEIEGLGASGEAEMAAIFKHLVDTRNLVATNPSLIKNNEDPQSFLKMLDYAIQYWNTDKRDEALAILAEKEREINELNGMGDMPEDYEEHTLFFGIEGLNGVSVLGKTNKVKTFFNKVKTAATQVKTAAVTAVKTAAAPIKVAAQKAGQAVAQVAQTAFKAIVKTSPLTVSARAGMLLALKLNIGKMAERLKWGYLTEAEAVKHGFDIPEWRKLKDRLAKSEHLFVDTMQGSAQHFKEAILTGRAGNLAGITDEEELGVDPITSSATLIATALPFVKKIVDLLKDIDMKKLTVKVKTDLLKKTAKAAEIANPIPPDVKTALPDNDIKPETKITVKPEDQNALTPSENLLPDSTIKVTQPAADKSDTPEQENFITKASNWVKENPGKSLLAVGGLLFIATAGRKMIGLGIVTGKRGRKGKKKNAPPKVTPKRKTNKKGKGGSPKTIHL